MTSSFESLQLIPVLLHNLENLGYTTPTPIQVKAIPEVLQGRDLMAAAQTGTGKTAAFALPILQKLRQENELKPQGKSPLPRVLVLSPTRELAAQIGESFVDYGKKTGLKSTVVFGGVSIHPQISALRKGVDILVATPGRLLDHHGQNTVDLSNIQILVLDEADRMLDMGFIHDIRRIISLLPQKRQNLLFSATFSASIRDLARKFMNEPHLVEASPANTAPKPIEQSLYVVDKSRKRDLLCHLVKDLSWQQVLVFCRTKHGAHRLSQQLVKAGISSTAIHGDRSQPQRIKALGDFKQNKIRVLVATDIAARGLDIEELPQVVNFDLPDVPEDYVHRIGRTGRAGASGHAMSLVCSEEGKLLQAIERLQNLKIERKIASGFEPLLELPDAESQRVIRQSKEGKEVFLPRAVRKDPSRKDQGRRDSGAAASQKSKQAWRPGVYRRS